MVIAERAVLVFDLDGNNRPAVLDQERRDFAAEVARQRREVGGECLETTAGTYSATSFCPEKWLTPGRGS